MSKADVEIRRELERLGYYPVRKRRHEVWRHPNGAQLSVSASIGRGRGMANMLAVARRLAAGYDEQE